VVAALVAGHGRGAGHHRHPGGHLERARLAERIDRALESLPTAHREVLVLCYLEERPLAEAAALLGVPEGTVKSRLFHRAREVPGGVRSGAVKPEPPDLEAWRQATTLPEPARARLTRRLAAWTTDRPGLAAQVRLDTEPAPGVVARVTRRLRQAPTASPWRWSVVALAAAVALAAVVAAWPSAPRVADVRMAFDGVGHVERSGAAPLVVWESGTAHLDVTPQRGLALSVRTPEAVIQVVGTVFDVHRQAHSTRVTVERGAVDVECVGNAHVLVPAGESVTCLPGTLDGVGGARAGAARPRGSARGGGSRPRAGGWLGGRADRAPRAPGDDPHRARPG
jgi:hypothetical protein